MIGLPIRSLGALLVLASSVVAKAPTLDNLFPAGAARGSTVEVTAAGQFERWPVLGWSSAPGIAIRAGGEKGKLFVSVAPDTPPGFHWVRLFDDDGPTSPRPFVVGTLPEVNEIEPNDEPGLAQRVNMPGTVVNGRLGKTGDVDGYRVHLQKGQTLVASMEANRRLGSPMDGVLQVASADGFVLAQNDDDHDRDPLIAFEAPADGDYLVRAFAFPFVQDSSIRFAGGPNFIYRLTLATRGVVDHPYPLAVSAGGPSEVEVLGWNIPEPAHRLAVAATMGQDSVSLFHPMLANPAEVRVVSEPSIVENEPNDPAHAQQIELPAAINGRIDSARDVDAFAFLARKGETLVIRVESRSLGHSLDAVLRILNASGSTLDEVDDAKGFDPSTRFTVPADGTYRLTVRDLNGQGGPRSAYLLTAGAPRPDFALSVKADQFTVVPGKMLDVVVTVERREGFAEPIEIGLAEHFDGVIAPSVTSARSGELAKSVTLRLRSCECVRPGPFRIVGTTRDGVSKMATSPAGGPSGALHSVWLTPTKPPAAKPEAARVEPPK